MVNYVVIGGGVAGVCCAEELCRVCPNDLVTLVAVDRSLKVGTASHLVVKFNSLVFLKLSVVTDILVSAECQHGG